MGTRLSFVLGMAILVCSAAGAAAERKLVVAFHPDVPFSDAERILFSAGVVRVEQPDLLPWHRLVIATEDQARALASVDEVAHVFPASEELARGEPVTGCPGARAGDGTAGQFVSTIGQGWDGAGKGLVALTYSLTNSTEQIPGAVLAATFEKAASEWAKHAALQFRRGDDPAAPQNINVLFAGGDHGDGYPFDGKRGVLAHTFYPAPVNPEPLAGDMHFDADETWTEGGQPGLYAVILHELGHALGLAHSDTPGAVMYPYYRGLEKLQPDDIEALQRLYGDATAVDDPQKPPPNNPDAQAESPGGDTVRPSLVITAPASPVYSTDDESIQIAGTAHDDAGIHRVTWKRGIDSGVAYGAESWSFTLPLQRGRNTIVVRAYDSAGNYIWRSIAVYRRMGGRP